MGGVRKPETACDGSRVGCSGVGPGPLLPVLAQAAWWELPRDRRSAAACLGLGGAWERLCCDPRPAATSVRLGAGSQKYSAR